MKFFVVYWIKVMETSDNRRGLYFMKEFPKKCCNLSASMRFLFIGTLKFYFPSLLRPSNGNVEKLFREIQSKVSQLRWYIGGNL